MKNIVMGILAHVDAGKTTLSESMLYLSGTVRKLGRVDHKDAFLDTYALERDRGITIFSKQAVFSLGNKKVNLLDTPGHVDFSAEMERTLQVLDYAVLVISGADGVQGHTETLWKLLKLYDIPTFIFINKMDQQGTDQAALLSELKERLDEGCIAFGKEENLIKAGACDGLDGNRHQMSIVYTSIVDDVVRRKKTGLEGQMSLFDFVGEEDKKDYEVHYPNVEEFPKEVLLGFEKEVLGIYLSGHPLEDYLGKMKKNVTANAADFVREEESGTIRVTDNMHVVVGGMIAAKTVKYTRNNQAMAFLTVEDLTGSVEIIVFPKDYERYNRFLNDEEKIFVVGHATVEEEQDGKVICERIVPFDDTRKELWLQFPTKSDFSAKEQQVYEILRDSDGNDEVVIYISDVKAFKRLPRNRAVGTNSVLLARLTEFLGEKNVKVVEKGIENRA